LCQATDFTDRVASGARTTEFAVEVERLQAQHADAVREKSAAKSKSRRLSEKLAAMEAERGGAPAPTGGGEEGGEQGHC
jgi:hypothetical protein